MVPIALMLYAAVLFINALFLLGRLEGKDVGPMNLIAGVLGILAAFFIFTSDPKGGATFAAVLVGTFAIVYLLVGAALVWGYSAATAGYYSIFGAIVCVLFAFNVLAADGRLAAMSLSYGVLFVLFAAVLAFGKSLQQITGFYTLAVVFGALVLPSFMMLTGRW
ncbi:AmiS/UreI family transporter [Deinococcus koreensis]|uniref:Transporter n=1 Tax=Deinococcus koreensis TaxID=2054903 RepID=A0A2K3UXJ7_9DEIO|nr:AmiS/UreI family transporter [Deinococcus koreensis]PNY81235.1 hypothetical protein CVO96_07425 [Deinococcus koreensis]